MRTHTRKAEGEAPAGDDKKEAQTTEKKEENKKQKKSKYDILIPISQAGLVDRLSQFYGLGPEFPSDQVCKCTSARAHAREGEAACVLGAKVA